MTLDKIGVSRLAFIRFLFNLAVEQSKRPEPLSSASILAFHDAIELESEYWNVGKRDIEFMEYWDLLGKKLSPNELSQKESMRRLSKARGELKHHGILVSKLDIEGFRVNGTNFFEENTRIVFGIEIYDVSLTELVQYEKAKDYVRKAEEALKQDKREDALDNVAFAFDQLIREYESTKIGKFGRPIFYFGRDMTFMGSSSWDFSGLMVRNGFGFRNKMREFVDSVTESLEGLKSAVKILSLGIDYGRYMKFRLLTPVVYLKGVKWETLRDTWGSKGIPTVEDVQFCIDFVIESAISLQELDFSLEGVS
jgi:hypothetical protein